MLDHLEARDLGDGALLEKFTAARLSGCGLLVVASHYRRFLYVVRSGELEIVFRRFRCDRSFWPAGSNDLGRIKVAIRNGRLLERIDLVRAEVLFENSIFEQALFF